MRLRLSLLMFLQYAPLGAVVPLFSLRLQELGFTPLEIGWSCATQSLAGLATPVLAGQVADRWWAAERCLGACALLAGTFLWLLAGLGSPPAVFAVSLAFWLTMAPAVTLGTSLSFAHLAVPARDFGGVRLWGTIGWVVAGWLVGYWLADPRWLGGLRAWLRPGSGRSELADAFRLGGVFCYLLALYALTLPHTPPQRSYAGALAPLVALRLLRSRPFLVYWVCVWGVCVTVPFTTQVMPLLLQALGVPQAWLSPVQTLGQSTEVVCLALLPMLMTRLGLRGTMRLGLVAWATYLAVLTLGTPTWLVVGSVSLNGLCICCFLVVGQVFVNSRTPAEVRASAQALISFMNSLGTLGGHLLVGWVRGRVQERFGPTFLVGAAIMAVLVVFFLFGFPADETAGPVRGKKGWSA